MARITLRLVVSLLFLLLVFGAIERAEAQVQPPDRKYLFEEDRLKKEKKDHTSKEADAIQEKRKSVEKFERSGKLPFGINAKIINYDTTGTKLLADGGLIVTYSTMILEAVKGVVDLTTNDAQVSGDVRISDLTGDITADSARVNLKSGDAQLENAEIFLAQGGFRLKGTEINRKQGDEYSLKDAELTTCQCAESKDCPPWRIRAKDAEIVRDGYGQVWNATLDVFNIPILYTPYLIFPAKTERQSGLLPATFGQGQETGFSIAQPFFWDINDSTDMTLTGIYESEVRAGLDTEYRQLFSRQHRLELGMVYLNESLRDGKLLGTNVDGLFDPSINTNRFGGFWEQTWKGDVLDLPLQFIADGHYANDDLLVREYDNERIADFNSRYITSRAVLRAPIGSSFSADLSTEYNQSLVSDDDLVFQRAPELSVDGINVFRVFGDNPYGLKLVSRTNLSEINFARDEGYDGTRSELYQAFKFPFFYRNYFDGELEANVRGTYYSLNNTIDPDFVQDPTLPLVDSGLEDNSTRAVPGVNGKIKTVFEKVFEAEEGNLFRTLGELGRLGREQQLARLKHTIEPGLKYKFVPEVNQDDNPQFDSRDRLAQKNVVTYELVQRMFARYEPRNTYLYGIEEATPVAEDLESIRADTPLDPELSFGVDDAGGADFQRLRSGSLREMLTFKLSQSYDILEESEDNDPDREPLSDLSATALLYPNEYFALGAQTDFDVENADFNAYTVQGQFSTKRGDKLRSRLRFVNDQVRQLESNVEVAVTEFIKLGYYTRYDDLDGEFIEQQAGVRFFSRCKCWVFDVNFADRINPDETKVTFNVTLVGLGELNQRFFTGFNQQSDSSTR